MMSAYQIILVIISGLGVIHGLFLALFLWDYPKGHRLFNRLLSVLLIVLSFRIGKSVFLEFIDHLDVKFIFTGLSTIMSIGPLYVFLVKSASNKSFYFTKKHLLHFIPTLLGFIFGLYITDGHLESLPIYFFAFLFLTYYLHFLIYLIIGYRLALQEKSEDLSMDVFKFLQLLFIGLLGIWVVYVFNLFDEDVPYIIGPILYSVVAYGLSFVVFKKGYIQRIDHAKYKTTPVSTEQIESLYSKVLDLVVTNQEYKNPDISLKSISGLLNVSPQVLSLVINQKSGVNFNRFINSHRIKEAQTIFKNEASKNLTVSAIAFEVGFNSISSFNTAFKKIVGTTPLSYRKQIIK